MNEPQEHQQDDRPRRRPLRRPGRLRSALERAERRRAERRQAGVELPLERPESGGQLHRLHSIVRPGLPRLVRLISALRYRGFLVESGHKSLLLSDNSSPGDIEAMRRLFTGLELPTEGMRPHRSGWHVASRSSLARSLESRDSATDMDRIVEHILDAWPRAGGEAFAYDGVWARFRARQHGKKVDVDRLEPAIAALAKAYNAAGAMTFTSCTGHAGQRNYGHPPYITFVGRYYAAWVRCMHELLGLQGIVRRWDGMSLKLARQPLHWRQRRLLDAQQRQRLLMQMTADAAAVIYAHRVELRELRRALIDDLRSQYGSDVPLEAFEDACGRVGRSCGDRDAGRES